MKFPRLAAVASAVVVCFLISGCGDTFRPVATPLPQPSPDPQPFRLAVMTACELGPGGLTPCNPSGATGQVSDINVSGDSVEGVVPVGRSPLFALVQNSGAVAVITTADFDNDTVSQHTDNHITANSAGVVSAPTTIGLPPGAQPISLASANGALYVAEFGRGVVGVVGGFPLALTTEIPVGTNPVNLGLLPNSSKVYVVNRGSNSVTAISTANNNVVATIPVGSGPAWTVASADSSRVFVVNQGSGSVSVIDATSDTVIATVTVGSSPNYAVFDARNQRVVVTNPGSNTVSVINADPTSPAFNNVTNVAVGVNPVSVTALADGTRIYVANTGSNSVSVINSLSLAVSKTISLSSTITAADQTPSPVWIASDSQSLKVFTANRDSRNASVILTSTDSELSDSAGKPIRIPAPNFDPTCAGASCVRLSPVFIAVGG
ncbi:MAG TPA: YncE family protein [Terriglobales bacterium]|nr:YncE family protein [Terriglobales bacterium]